MVQLLSGLIMALWMLQAPTPTGSRGSLEGTVLDSVTGLPVEGVHVAIVPGQAMPEDGVRSLLDGQKPTLQNPQVTKVIPAFTLGGRTLVPERSAHSVLTDARGRFSLVGLPPATYSLALRADGYNFQIYGEKPDSLSSLPVVINEDRIDLGVLRLSPYPRVSGRVVDLDRRPIERIPVYLLHGQPYNSVDGEKRPRLVIETLTDAEGRYSFEKFEAGSYSVAVGSSGRPELISFSARPGADPAGTRMPALAPYPYTFYPGVPDFSLAGKFDVPAGSRIALGDLVVPRYEFRSVRGRVVDSATGKPPESVRVVLNGWFPFVRAGSDSTEILGGVRYDRTTGVFEFTNLIPGRYRVDAVLPRSPVTATPMGSIGGIPTNSAFQILDLRDRDAQDLVLTVPGTGRVVGKVVVADGKPLPVAEVGISIPLQLQLTATSPLQPVPVVTAVSVTDGSFEVPSGLDGVYRYSLHVLRDNYYVSETRLDGVRASNGRVEISKNTSSELILTLSPGGEIQGYVVDKQGQPVKLAEGLLLPDPLPEIIPYYQRIYAEATGRFTINGVPPGSYRIYLWEGVEPARFFDRELLLQFAGAATQVRVERGSQVSARVLVITP